MSILFHTTLRRLAGARKYNGSSDGLLFPGLVTPDGEYTIASWFFPRDNTTDQCILQVAKNEVDTYERSVSLYLRGATAGDPLSARSYNGSPTYTDTSTGIVLNKWQHGIAVINGGAATAEVLLNNGGKGTGSSVDLAGELNSVVSGYIKNYNEGNNSFFNGMVAEQCIWNVILTDAERTALYQGKSPLNIRPENLLFYAPMGMAHEIGFFYRGTVPVSGQGTSTLFTGPDLPGQDLEGLLETISFTDDPAGVSGTLNVTLADFTVAAQGDTTINGTLNSTLAAVTLAGQGNVDIAGTVNVTLADVTSAAQGAVGADGTLNVTLADVTLAGQGNVDNAGTVNVTVADVTLAGQGDVNNSGTLNLTIADATAAAQGDVTIDSTLNITIDAVTIAAQGAVGTVATVNATIADVTLSGQGDVNNSGTLNLTIGDVTLVGSGTVSSAGGGSPVVVIAPDAFANGLESALALNLSASNGGGVSGLTVQLKIRDGSTANSYLDFNDMTFKTSGWTTKQVTLTDLTGGFYTTLLDLTSIVSLPQANLSLEYTISGSLSAVAMASIVRVDLGVLNSLSALTVGKFLALKDA